MRWKSSDRDYNHHHQQRVRRSYSRDAERSETLGELNAVVLVPAQQESDIGQVVGAMMRENGIDLDPVSHMNACGALAQEISRLQEACAEPIARYVYDNHGWACWLQDEMLDDDTNERSGTSDYLRRNLGVEEGSELPEDALDLFSDYVRVELSYLADVSEHSWLVPVVNDLIGKGILEEGVVSFEVEEEQAAAA